MHYIDINEGNQHSVSSDYSKGFLNMMAVLFSNEGHGRSEI